MREPTTVPSARLTSRPLALSENQLHESSDDKWVSQAK
jgi:hypothetical protein